MSQQRFVEGDRSAWLSEDRQYRYELQRWWRERRMRMLTWVLLNPSTADEQRDDPTIRRVVAFSRRWGYDGCRVLNLFALRATDPRELQTHDDPIGPANDHLLLGVVGWTPTVFAWGSNRMAGDRAAWLLATMAQLRVYCLGYTRDRFPRHPLYVRGDRELEVFAPTKGWDEL